jgi:hypothetical protein
MAGVKGRSGVNRNKLKPFEDALRMEINAAGDDHKCLRRIAAKLLAMAEGGELQAIGMVADRLDGKPAQESTVTVRNELDTMNDVELRDFIRRELEAAGRASDAAQEPPDTRVIN